MKTHSALFVASLSLGALSACGDGSSGGNGGGGTSAGGANAGGASSTGAGHPGHSSSAVGGSTSTGEAGGGGAAPSGGTGGATTGSGGSTSGTGGSSASHRQSWVWVYTDWSDSAAAITSHASSFTHISPTFYDFNAHYTGGVIPYWNCSSNNPCKYEGKTPAQYTAELKAAGLKVVPLIYGGSANGGTDENVQDLLNDVNGQQAPFISAMVAEAVAQDYDGYNLDWELGSTGSAYADKFVSFLDAFQSALAAHQMTLSVDAILSNVDGTWCSSDDGYIDFGKLAGSNVDAIIVEDYTGSLGPSSTMCNQVTLSHDSPANCPLNAAQTDVTFTGVLDFMCSNLPTSKIVIGMQSDSTNTNPIANDAFTAIDAYGFTGVAVWPQVETSAFMSSKSLQGPANDWYELLGGFLAQP